jgi:hypothetical protein
MIVDICIPTMRPLEEIEAQLEQIEATAELPHRIIASCQPASASINRNFCLHFAASPIIIMLDDDIEGFFPGWDARLLEIFDVEPKATMVSARLMTSEWKVGLSCARNKALVPRWVEIFAARDCLMPSAAIAFRNLGHRFNEGFVGSGWEDNDFCFKHLFGCRARRLVMERVAGHFGLAIHDYLLTVDVPRFYVDNGCQLIHRNEMKNQFENDQFSKNRKHFYELWGIVPDG